MMNPLRWRKMTWVLALWTALALVLIVAGAGNQPACPPGVANCEAYQAGATIGTGLAVTAILGVWFVGFIILSIIWFMTRPARRICPACGHEARKGQTICKKCGHAFAAPVPSAPVPS
jgi:hypothetical protein